MFRDFFAGLKRVLVLPANWFLFLMVLITALNCGFWYQDNYVYTSKGNLESLSITILESQKSTFNSRYLASSSFGNLILDTKNNYKIGYEFLVSGELEKFGLEGKSSEDATAESQKEIPPKSEILTPFDKGVAAKTDFGDGILKLVQNDSLLKEKVDFSSYYLSIGVVGKLTKDVVLTANPNCDLKCLGLQQVANLRFQFKFLYDQIICKQLNFVNQFFHNSCDKVLAWTSGLVLGQGDLFDTKTKADLKNIGIVHLVVISGFQVGLLFVLVDFVFLKLRFGRKVRLLFCAISLGFLILIAGLQPPILRSSLSILISSFGLIWLGRGLNVYRALVYSALVLLWIFPNYIVSYSFWLSFAATFGLIMFGSSSSQIVEIEWFQNFKTLVRSCVGTFLFTLPLIVNLSGGVSLLGILANIILIPVIPFLTLVNLFSLIPFVGELFGLVAVTMQNLLIIVVQDLAQFAFRVSFEKFSILEIVLYWVGLSLGVKLIFKK